MTTIQIIINGQEMKEIHEGNLLIYDSKCRSCY